MRDDPNVMSVLDLVENVAYEGSTMDKDVNLNENSEKEIEYMLTNEVLPID
jgi:hypothetical protein